MQRRRISKDRNYLEILRLLLQHPKVDPNYDDSRALRISCRDGYLDIVILLLQHPKINPSSQNNCHIEYAVRYGHLEIVKLLLNHTEFIPTDDNTIIYDASKYGHLEIIKFWLDHPKGRVFEEYNYVVECAASRGHFEIVKLLLGHPKFATFSEHEDAIKCALQDGYMNPNINKNHLKIVNLLLAQPGVDKSFENCYILRTAAVNGCLQLFKLVLAHSIPDKDSPYNNIPQTIMCSFENGHSEIVKLLLENFGHSYVDNENYLINKAIVKNDVTIVRTLLSIPTFVLHHNNTIFHNLVMNKNLEMADLVLSDHRLNLSKNLNTQLFLIRMFPELFYKIVKDNQFNFLNDPFSLLLKQKLASNLC